MKKPGFTLVEILIVVILFGLLSGIILETYTTITKVAFRMEQDKELAQETLILSQVLQNISEEATIDYEKYHDLKENNWITDKLYLTGWNRTGMQISSTWTCESVDKLYNENYRQEQLQSEQNEGEKPDFSSCALLLTREWSQKAIPLISTWKIMQSKITFKIIPYDSNANLLKDVQYDHNTEEEIKQKNKLWKPWFWILGAVYSKFYDPQKRSNSSILPLQHFFTLQGKTPSIYEITTENDDA